MEAKLGRIVKGLAKFRREETADFQLGPTLEQSFIYVCTKIRIESFDITMRYIKIN